MDSQPTSSGIAVLSEIILLLHHRVRSRHRKLNHKYTRLAYKHERHALVHNLFTHVFVALYSGVITWVVPIQYQ